MCMHIFCRWVHALSVQYPVCVYEFSAPGRAHELALREGRVRACTMAVVGSVLLRSCLAVLGSVLPFQLPPNPKPVPASPDLA